MENVDQRWIFYDSDEIEIRLPFYRSFGIYLVVFALKYSLALGKRWLEVICVVKSKLIQLYQKYSKFNKEKIGQRHSFKPKANSNFKVLLGPIIKTITQLNSLFVFFYYYCNKIFFNRFSQLSLILFS